MNRLKLILISFLISAQAFAGLPPTTSKGTGDTTSKVTFNYQFPAHQITHSGPTATILPPTSSTPNFVGQTTAWAPTNTDDRDLETSAGNWASFKDAAAAIPVDLTGGSPSITCTRATSDPKMDGAGWLEVTTTAANRQGEGCSVVFNVQPAYQGQTVTISAAMKVTSGSLVQGDWKWFVYDVTNSILITPFNNDIVASGPLVATFPTTSSASPAANQQYRLGIYRASSNATANVLHFDNFSISPGQAVFGAAGSSWAACTLTGSFTTNTTYSGLCRRVMDAMEVQARISFSGSPNAVNSTINLPTGYTIDTSKITATGALTTPVGQGTARTGTTYNLQALYSTSTSVGLFYQNNTSGAVNFVDNTGPGTWASGSTIDVKFSVPIVGWDSGWAGANSTSFKISSYLANGTRVTTTPANLGEYRTQYFTTGSSITIGEATSPPAPTAADGMRVYARAWASAQTTSQPAKWDIFVGKDKSVKLLTYSGTGRSGTLDPSLLVSGNDYGLLTNYDPTTGVYTVFARNLQASGTHYVGRSGFDAANTGGDAPDGYFDLVVSENALAVGIEPFPYASYNSSTTTAMSAGADTVLPFANKVADTHSAYNTSTGLYSVPQAGYWCAKSSIVTSVTAWSTGNQQNLRLYKNGSHVKTVGTVVAQTAGSFRMSVNGEGCINANLGDTLAIYGRASVANTLEGTASENWVEFRKVAN